MRARRHALAALLAAALSLAPGDASAAAPHLVVEVAPRASARAGAVRLRVALRNASEKRLGAAADPARLLLSVRDADGNRLSCAPAPRPAHAAALAPGERARFVVDLGARCGVTSAGTYTVGVAYDAPGGRTPEALVALRVTRWVNPGPLSPGQRSQVQGGE